jgi:hypothetical protein
MCKLKVLIILITIAVSGVRRCESSESDENLILGKFDLISVKYPEYDVTENPPPDSDFTTEIETTELSEATTTIITSTTEIITTTFDPVGKCV